MTRGSILKTKVTKEALVEDKYQKNDSAMNSQNLDKNDLDSTSAKDKDKKIPSEATEETKKEKNPKSHNQRINFKDILKNHNVLLILKLTELKITV